MSLSSPAVALLFPLAGSLTMPATMAAIASLLLVRLILEQPRNERETQ